MYLKRVYVHYFINIKKHFFTHEIFVFLKQNADHEHRMQIKNNRSAYKYLFKKKRDEITGKNREERNKSSNSPRSNSWTIGLDDERWLSGSHVTVVMMRSVAIPRDPLYIWEAAVPSMGDEREKDDEGERERVSAQVAARKRPRGHGAQASSSCPAPVHPSSSLSSSRASERREMEGSFRCRDYAPESSSLRNLFHIESRMSMT